MKKILLIATCILAVWDMMAQDIIITNDAKKIDAKIIEVSKKEIRYKEADNIDGPTFILEMSDINSIIYSNGKVVLHNQTSTIHSKESDTESSATSKAKQLGSLFGNKEATTAERGEPVARNSKGNSWSLQDRSLVGKLETPTYYGMQDGNVIIEIVVDKTGNVI